MKKIFIDLEICYRCKECRASCSYFYHMKNNKGYIKLIEMASKAFICRRCEEAPCIEACPNEALEKKEGGALTRHSMLCTGCQTCTLACPFGVVYPEITPYKVSQCDYCSGRADDKLPLCVETCPEKAIQYRKVDESKEKNVCIIENLVVHALPWSKK